MTALGFKKVGISRFFGDLNGGEEVKFQWRIQMS